MNRFWSKSFIQTFSKSQIASAAATGAEYCVLTFWVEILHQFYPIGVALGAGTGAVINFFMNRHWSFRSTEMGLSEQAKKYVIVSAGSLLLNTGLVYLLTETTHLHYLASTVIVGLAVGFFYNYPLQRNYVYPEKKLETL